MVHNIEIPEFYLLTISVHGNMGDGELPDMMRIWAQKECRKLGIDDKMNNMQIQRLAELKERIGKVIGKDNVRKIETECTQAAEYINNKRNANTESK